MNYNYKVHDKRVCYKGFFTFYEYSISFSSFRGGMLNGVIRECSKKGSVSSVVAYDKEKDSFLIVEQFRIGLVERDDFPWSYEIISGFVDTKETPIVTAKRELVEETGCKAEKIVPLIEYISSPGGSGGKSYIYLASINTDDVKEFTGLKSENEDIRVHIIKREKITNMMKSNECTKLHNSTAIIAFSTLFSNWDFYLKKI